MMNSLNKSDDLNKVAKLETQKTPLWKEYWYVTFLIGAFFVLAVSTIIRSVLPKNELVTDQPNSWGVITPGHSTINQASQQLGQPISNIKTDLGVVSTFNSFNTFSPHEIVTDQNGTVVFAKEFLKATPNHKLSQYTNQYGQPDLKLIDKNSSDALTANVFLKQGLVVLAHNADETVEQKWYFEPTNQDSFLKSWGSELTTETHGPEVQSLP